MKAFCLLFALGLWACFVLYDVYVSCLFIFAYSLYLYFRTRKKLFVLLWIGFSIFSLFYIHTPFDEAKPGKYMIYQIKENYCLGRNGDTSIVLYGIKEPHYYDVYHVVQFDKIHSISNIGQFSFSEYMAKQSIYYSSNVNEYMYIQTIPSIKDNIYTYFLNHKNHEYYLSNFYGISSEDITTIITNLGLPILGFVSILRNLLQKFFKRSVAQILVFIFLVFYGSLFVFTPSLVRIIVFEMGKIFFSKWEIRLSMGVCMYCFLCPGYAAHFIFLFPVSMMLLFHLCPDMFKRMILSKIILAVFQLFFFHKIDVVLFCFFSLFRKLNSFIFLLSFPGILFGSCFDWLISMYTNLVSYIPTFVFTYVPNFVFLLVSFSLMVRIYWNRKTFFTSCLFVLMIILGKRLDPFFHVYLMDIGQGDCTLITEPFLRSAVLIDCGQNLNRDNVEEIIVPFIKDNNIDALDAVIITHEDFDHSGGLKRLSQMIEIDQVVQESFQKVNVNYPFYSLLEKRESYNENDSSIISYFAYDELKYLWMGDAGVDIEKQLIETYDLEVDVLKVGHHGSNTSSSYEFLSNIHPSLGLISVGEKNRYNHPSRDVIANLNDLSINVLMTKDVGMIHIFTFKHFALFQTASGLFGIL